MNLRLEPHRKEGSATLAAICEQEPIHIPGAIQPHGAMLAALVEGRLVTHASANLIAILGRPAEAVLGQPLEHAIGEAACLALRGIGTCDGLALRQWAHVLAGPGGEALHLRAFRSGRHLCVDIEPAAANVSPGLADNMLQSTLESFRKATSPAELCELAVTGLKAISGFDRVMAYRFDRDGHGEVIAEAVESHLDPFRGLHYPAADIPAQARKLILAQPVGRIADTSYRPIPLLADAALHDGTPLDLTHSALRSVSPYHLEYLRNMKVAACLTIGLAEGQDLWGMLVCHHMTPRLVIPRLKAVAQIIGQVVALLLVSRGKAEIDAQRLKRIAILRALVARLAVSASPAEALNTAASELLALVDAAGAAVRLSGKLFCVGCVPPRDVVEYALATLLPHAGDDVLAIDDLGLRFPGLACCAREGSGVLLLPLTPGTDDLILWFRPEFERTVSWGGNPAEHVSLNPVDGRLSPRGSFAAWKEIVNGRSVPWVEADLTLARDLRGVVIVEMAKRTKAELFELRHYDPLTGLPNRRLLQERLAGAGPETWVAATLLFLDLDVTKEINETMGYAAGDVLLIEVARRLVAAAGPENLAARLGGDEFVVLCWDRLAVDELSKRIRRAIEAPFEIFGRPWHVSPGIGTAAVDHSSGIDVVGVADSAMQAARITIEAKRKAEAQRQKMEMLGRTMGGIGHEINNMLQPMILLVEDVIDQQLVVGEGKPHLDIVLDCCRKARQIIRDMLAFSRPTASNTEIHDPVVLLHDSLPIVRQALPPDLVVTLRIEESLPLVRINRTTFVQILLNLAINAAAAMNGQGELTIALEQDVRGPEQGETGQPTRLVRLLVIDNGVGMDQATLDRAFEPFFTTKPIGQGTGLGLPVVSGLLRAMGATIGLASEPGCGTTVTILIPGYNGELDNGVDTNS